MPLVLIALLAGCNNNLSSTVVTDTSFTQSTDNDPPLIVTTPVEEAQPLGQDVTITADVSDAGTGVLFVTLYYKNETGGSSDWARFSMVPSSSGPTAADDTATPPEVVTWTGTISGAAENSAGIYYYIEAVDGEQNTSTSPTRGADDPYHFRVYAE
jgi:hypothetical protein